MASTKPEEPIELPEIDLIQPTAAETRNGWTAQTLTKYMRERMGQKAKFAMREKKHKVVRVENHYGFDPFAW